MQTFIVILILALTLFFTVRWIVRQVKGNRGCGCGCNGCPMSGKKDCHCHDKNALLN